MAASPREGADDGGIRLDTCRRLQDDGFQRRVVRPRSDLEDQVGALGGIWIVVGRHTGVVQVQSVQLMDVAKHQAPVGLGVFEPSLDRRRDVERNLLDRRAQ